RALYGHINSRTFRKRAYIPVARVDSRDVPAATHQRFNVAIFLGKSFCIANIILNSRKALKILFNHLLSLLIADTQPTGQAVSADAIRNAEIDFLRLTPVI